MSAPAVDRIFLFRIVHWECLPAVLDRGFYPKRHPGFLFPKLRIGDVELADKRDSWALRTPGAGTIGEHVAFYFAGHSPMLYKIKTGYGVPLVDQRDIVYICLKLEEVASLSRRSALRKPHCSAECPALDPPLAGSAGIGRRPFLLWRPTIHSHE